MSINVGDLVRIKKYVKKATRGEYQKTQVESPVTGSRKVSPYFAPEFQGRVGLVTSISRATDDDTMWVPPLITLLLDTGESIAVYGEELTHVVPTGVK